MEEKNIVYITNANYKRILKSVDLNSIKDLKGNIYKRKIYFYNRWEEKELLLAEYLLKNPQGFVDIYKAAEVKDRFMFVYEEPKLPAYHRSTECERLTSDFKNFFIPIEIKSRAREKAIREGKSKEEIMKCIEQEVKIFRNWFNRHSDVFMSDTEEFLRILEIHWNIKNIKVFEGKNSGAYEILNQDLKKLEHDIDELLRESRIFYVNNPDKQSIIKNYQGRTFLAYKKEPIPNNTKLTESELRQFLKDFDEKFKSPTRRMLIDYYRVKFNPDLKFEKYLLDILNFKPCGACHKPKTYDDSILEFE
ncbi:hypothetical protein M2459_002715 [Parabacteroides sp. PF5-5]|uniref:hypothetical protein n=1 Tax=unclassified Parabacteroides TaxID=2649774 RepID=UPI002473C51C|nr:MULTISPECIES: hypothetical protein [unclassified Parabacteroides]MDH6305928.1 hypothetical protein [Parabacteroides sp. PH5-39]MDH6316857.1 hypothetical protein [Parabacteroides sp. PF5-13]MDH6320640.1 hypothetical protein [Parabacteroides sp. PH5-13]MDH6324439.1 hypothetical protein [Parabacteroides sp. PH5-8]MDH6328042.1 hypothetical protein [Parabacteroides sp. PH5-41]